MFFSTNPVQLTIREVYFLKRQNITIYTNKKPHHCIGYRLSGESVFYLKEKEFHIKKGDAIYVPPYIPYHQRTAEEALIAIHFDAPELCCHDFSIAHFSDNETADHKFLQLLDVWNSRQPGYQYRATAILYDILADIRQQTYTQNEHVSKAELQLMDSLEYLHRNYYKSDLNIRDIAAVSHVSEVYFRKLFHELYQTSPLKYINNLRITKAMTLLKTDNTPVKSIAAAVGFSDPLYFSRVFKKFTGTSPAEFRLLDAPPLNPYFYTSDPTPR